MHFWLNYCDESNHHIERIPVAVKNMDHLFRMASEVIKSDILHLFLFSDGTRIDDDEYLGSLEDSTEFIVCTDKKILKPQKHLLSVKHRLFSMNLVGCFK